jgi:hypothetical protein
MIISNPSPGRQFVYGLGFNLRAVTDVQMFSKMFPTPFLAKILVLFVKYGMYDSPFENRNTAITSVGMLLEVESDPFKAVVR